MPNAVTPVPNSNRPMPAMMRRGCRPRLAARRCGAVRAVRLSVSKVDGFKIQVQRARRVNGAQKWERESAVGVVVPAGRSTARDTLCAGMNHAN
ncbi:hypothetical protein FQZ97_876680 [compost metagenome]